MGSGSKVEMVTVDVGNGSCHMVSGPGGWVMVDGGSTTRTACAQRTIIPMIRKMDVSRLDAVIITHANLDHYSAIADIVSRVPVGRVILGPSFMVRARADEQGPERAFIDVVRMWSVPIEVVIPESRMIIAGLAWRFIHPRFDMIGDHENDNSLVMRVEAEKSGTGERCMILFTGDIEESAMRHLMIEQANMLDAAILEAPHHGSVRRSTSSFVQLVDPDLVVQSSGRRRLVRDDFGNSIGSRWREATAISGAIKVVLKDGGEIEVERQVKDRRR